MTKFQWFRCKKCQRPVIAEKGTKICPEIIGQKFVCHNCHAEHSWVYPNDSQCRNCGNESHYSISPVFCEGELEPKQQKEEGR